MKFGYVRLPLSQTDFFGLLRVRLNGIVLYFLINRFQSVLQCVLKKWHLKEKKIETVFLMETTFNPTKECSITNCQNIILVLSREVQWRVSTRLNVSTSVNAQGHSKSRLLWKRAKELREKLHMKEEMQPKRRYHLPEIFLYLYFCNSIFHSLYLMWFWYYCCEEQ